MTDRGNHVGGREIAAAKLEYDHSGALRDLLARARASPTITRDRH